VPDPRKAHDAALRYNAKCLYLITNFAALAQDAAAQGKQRRANIFDDLINPL
jgi:hypothetical protein